MSPKNRVFLCPPIERLLIQISLIYLLCCYYARILHNSKKDIVKYLFVLQLYSKKCTGRYFKLRDDDLSSKQGSVCAFKMILKKITQKSTARFIKTYRDHVYKYTGIR